ncbi:hypothetical protein [Cupriavidus consociatus]|uniref:hypothetical protein n=1 Tax=Cupriavidus consociatus TaxID=2821357 RepID=UPI001AE16570|nr:MULTISPECIES: hypothetical protein [unclassified Cupriavidus]MBP0621821.1 hypothetical protein [Cupriavidus sp. LEh25]MDK2658496.1 hypothetical protein [Cupriavidus sp. LEh21]
MKFITFVPVLIPVLAGTAQAAEVYDDYDAFYASRPGAIFYQPIETDHHTLYSDRKGIHATITGSINGKTARISVFSNHMTINGKSFSYSRAITFPDEHASPIDPGSVVVFVTSRTRARPSVLCLEGDSNGSGEADRHKQIYLLIDPLAHQGKPSFLHLPSLLSSCRAIRKTKNTRLAFPKNSYLFNSAEVSRVGLLISYYTFTNQRFVPTSDAIRLRFAQPEIPFEFSLKAEK